MKKIILLSNKKGGLGPEKVVNYDFSNGINGWDILRDAIVDTTNDEALITNGSVGYGGISQPIILEAGKNYLFSFDYTHIDASGFPMVSTTNTGGGTRFIPVENLQQSDSYSYLFTPTVANVFVVFSLGHTPEVGRQGIVDNISVREVL